MAAASTPETSVILHLGLGSFHRAHQVVYQQMLHDKGNAQWVYAGGNIRADMAETIAALQESGGAYTLETISPENQREYKRISAIRKVISHDKELSGLVACGADPSTRILSFTVTEAGYYLDAANKLDLRFPDLAADIAAAKEGHVHPETPTIYGALTAILRARRAASAGPVTLQCCDNLRHNGDRSRAGLLQFLELVGDQELLAWVKEHTTSPNAMVDRITPRPTAEVRTRVKEATGVDDPAALMSESFLQWVIEDRFAAGRPSWEDVGVQMVSSVDAYEEAKIRLLNATHSCVAWAGTLVGYLYIHEGTQDPAIRQMAFDYITDDAIPVLNTPEKPCPLDLAAYRDVVLARFANAAIIDTNQRVVMDGFSKLPGFIVPTIRERLARNESISSVAVLPALFLAFLQKWNAGGLPYGYQDQAMDPLVAVAMCSAADPVAAFCADTTLFGPQANDSRLVEGVRAASEKVAKFVEAHASQK